MEQKEEKEEKGKQVDEKEKEEKEEVDEEEKEEKEEQVVAMTTEAPQGGVASLVQLPKSTNLASKCFLHD